jgi:hypothetical protein
MARNLCLMVILALQTGVAAAEDAALAATQEATVRAYKYELSLKSRSEWTNHFGVSVEYKLLGFRGVSPGKVPGNGPSDNVFVTTTSTSDGIDAVATKSDSFVGKPKYPPEKPAKYFQFDIKSLQLKPDGWARVRFEFQDATDVFFLRYCPGEGLKLEPVNVAFGRTDVAIVPEFVNLITREGNCAWQCNSLTTSATKDGKPLWSTDLPMQGQPESMSVLDQLLFVKTTGGHSFYIRKDTGKMVFYDDSVMVGKNATDDILFLWHRDVGFTLQQRNKKGFYRFIRAAVLLDNKRFIPLLLECVEKGQGLPEKCAAVAALEKFNGNPDLWVDEGRLMEVVGMNRVFPAGAAKAERTKWETVFKDQLNQ